MVFKFFVTLKQQLLLSGFCIILNLSLVGIYLYFFGFSLPYSGFLISFALLFVLTVLPVIIVHVQYLFENGGADLVISKVENTISYKSRKKQIVEKLSDIESLHHYASYGSNSGLYTFGEYRYFKIIFKDQQEIIVTSLMMSNIKNELEKLLSLKAEKHFKLVAFIS